MYLETWMLVTLFIAWMISLVDLWRSGLHRGVDVTLDMLEQNQMIITEIDEEGNKMICKIVQTESIDSK